ncbi:hypothetical protein WJ970_08410 [Achromobacter xylosoxidans]
MSRLEQRRVERLALLQHGQRADDERVHALGELGLDLGLLGGAVRPGCGLFPATEYTVSATAMQWNATVASSTRAWSGDTP